MAIYPNHNFSPLQPYFKYLKTLSSLQKLSVLSCPAEINEKQSMLNKRFNDHLI